MVFLFTLRQSQGSHGDGCTDLSRWKGREAAVIAREAMLDEPSPPPPPPPNHDPSPPPPPPPPPYLV